MALDSSRLAAAIKAGLLAGGVAVDSDQLNNTCNTIAGAIVDEISDNLTITLPAASFGVNGTGATPNLAVTCTVE